MRYLLALLLLEIAASPVFAQAPSTGYISGTPDAPSTDGETGFSFIVVIDSSFTDFWAEAENTNADRGRVYRNDGTTKLNCHWIKYDHSGQSAIIRFNDTAALSPTTYRIYPPVAANAQDDTSASAYDANWEFYSADGGGNDLTSNGHVGTAGGGVTVGAASGKIDDGTDYEETSNQYVGFGDILAFDETTTDITFIAWANPESFSGSSVIFSRRDGFNYEYAWRFDSGGNLECLFESGTVDSGLTASTGTPSFCAVSVASGACAWRLNGSTASVGTGVTYTLGAGVANFQISGYDEGTGDPFDGILDELQVHSVARSAEWIAYEYAQTNDNAAFWNTWTWNAASSSSSQLLRTLLESQ